MRAVAKFLIKWEPMLGLMMAVTYFASIGIHMYIRHLSNGAVGLLDFECNNFPNTYSQSALTKWVEEMTKNGRIVHTVHTVVVDTVLIFSLYPFLGSCFMSFGYKHAGYMKAPVVALGYAPLVPMLFDIAENVLVLVTFKRYATGSELSEASVLSHCTLLKFLTAIPLCAVALVLFVLTKCMKKNAAQKDLYPDICV
eukprot:TRINITY_DN20065_c0_g1_i1.p1 TRINITY_DN20065_c0_g1~~TRINITY_DN20065_c0_g1_i1.p1  ORF type:complete len:208 (+),score=74.39 TRINITY_DN20065_c0_g1_i1:35-625(+)